MRALFLSLICILHPVSCNADSIQQIVSEICNNADNFAPIHELAEKSALAPELVNVIKDVNQSSCWSKASEVLRGLGPNAKVILPELLNLIRDSSQGLNGPIRELQQAFAISALPQFSASQFSWTDSADTVSTLIRLLTDNHVSSDMKTLISNTLTNRFSHDASLQQILRLFSNSQNNIGMIQASPTYSKRDLQRALQELKNTSQQEANKWIQLFNRELKNLNRSRMR